MKLRAIFRTCCASVLDGDECFSLLRQNGSLALTGDKRSFFSHETGKYGRVNEFFIQIIIKNC